MAWKNKKYVGGFGVIKGSKAIAIFPETRTYKGRKSSKTNLRTQKYVTEYHVKTYDVNNGYHTPRGLDIVKSKVKAKQKLESIKDRIDRQQKRKSK